MKTKVIMVGKAQTVKPQYCFCLIRPKVSTSKGFGLFQQLHYNLIVCILPLHGPRCSKAD